MLTRSPGMDKIDSLQIGNMDELLDAVNTNQNEEDTLDETR